MDQYRNVTEESQDIFDAPVDVPHTQLRRIAVENYFLPENGSESERVDRSANLYRLTIGGVQPSEQSLNLARLRNMQREKVDSTL